VPSVVISSKTSLNFLKTGRNNNADGRGRRHGSGRHQRPSGVLRNLILYLSATSRRREALLELKDNFEGGLDLSGASGAVVLTDLGGGETEQWRAEGDRTGRQTGIAWCYEVRMVEEVVALDPED